MNKLPTAEEFIKKEYALDNTESHYNKLLDDDVYEVMIEFTKLHVKACKEEIKDDYLYYLEGDEGSERLDSKKFSKEAYPLENIK